MASGLNSSQLVPNSLSAMLPYESIGTGMDPDELPPVKLSMARTCPPFQKHSLWEPICPHPPETNIILIPKV